MLDRPISRKPKPTVVTSLDAGGKIQPQAVDFEEAILGAIMLEKEALKDAMETLQSKHFYSDKRSCSPQLQKLGNGSILRRVSLPAPMP